MPRQENIIGAGMAGITDHYKIGVLEGAGVFKRTWTGSPSSFSEYYWKMPNIVTGVITPASYKFSGVDNVDEWARLASKGLTASMVMEYQEQGLFDTNDMLRLIDLGMSHLDYRMFVSGGITNIDEIVWFVKTGVNGVDADLYRRAGFSAEQIQELVSNSIGGRKVMTFIAVGVSEVSEIIKYSEMGLDGVYLNRCRMIGVEDYELDVFVKALGERGPRVIQEALSLGITDKSAVLNIINAGMSIPSARERVDMLGWNGVVDERLLESAAQSVPLCSARVRSGGRLISIETVGWDLKVDNNSLGPIVEAERVMAALGGKSRLMELYDSWISAITADTVKVGNIPKSLRPAIEKARLAYGVAAWLGRVPKVRLD